MQTNLLCFGGNNGSAKAGIKGGTPPYTYVWSAGKPSAGYDSLLSAGSTLQYMLIRMDVLLIRYQLT